MAKKKILIIDDEEDFTRIVKLNLEETGKYEVKTENFSSDYLSAIKSYHPDLALIDVIMFDIGDLEILQQDQVIKDIPIVFLTAAPSKEQISSKSNTLFGRPFLVKPVDKASLISCIDRNIC